MTPKHKTLKTNDPETRLTDWGNDPETRQLGHSARICNS